MQIRNSFRFKFKCYELADGQCAFAWTHMTPTMQPFFSPAHFILYITAQSAVSRQYLAQQWTFHHYNYIPLFNGIYYSLVVVSHRWWFTICLPNLTLSIDPKYKELKLWTIEWYKDITRMVLRNNPKTRNPCGNHIDIRPIWA